MFNPRSAAPLFAAVAVSALFVVGCGKSQPTNADGGGTETPDAGCDGQIGCACAAGACSVGECMSGTCVDCRRGEEACVCRANNTCNAGLRCNGSTVCEACPAGENGCACNNGDVCNAGLVCSNGTCTPDTCTAGANGCPCNASDPKCDGDQYCDGTNRCQSCSADVVGCGCGTSGVCLGGLVCETSNNKCRMPLTCADLLAGGQCKQNQTCNETPGQDAVCVPDSCSGDFKWDPSSQSCVACVSAGCTNEPTCASGDGGIGDSCAALNRACDQNGLVASCGACLNGFAQPVGDGGTQVACQPMPTCGSVTCAVDQYCDKTSGTPTCALLPCPTGQAKGTNGQCSSCTRTCNGSGFSGRIWPFKTNLDVCLCETLDGYFLPGGGLAQAEICDADNDGWVREEADDSLVRSDPAIQANARCIIRKVDKVRLVDEYGLSSTVLSCATGLLQDPDAGSCASSIPLRLLETQRNDVPGKPVAPGAPEYGPLDGGLVLADGGSGDQGRMLQANELNTLTKGCVSLAADFNDNGKDDISEVQQVTATTNDRARLESFAFFMELYSSYYSPPAQGEAYGTLVIKEKSRCDSDFPLRYDVAQDPLAATDWYQVQAGGPYWRNCTRGRDVTYNSASNEAGYDFAQWDCAATAGGCAIPPPAHATLVAPVNPKTTALRNFGLCELNGQIPADRKWRGMEHHSQFKCVSVQSAAPAAAYQKNLADFGSSDGALVFNSCRALPCGGTGQACAQTQGSGLQTMRPYVSCRAEATPALGAVGFAAVTYRPYRGFNDSSYSNTTYVRGCINEDDAYNMDFAVSQADGGYTSVTATYTCPFPEYSLAKSDADNNFGRYSCWGKGTAFLWCDSPCTPLLSTLHYANGPTDTANGVLR